MSVKTMSLVKNRHEYSIMYLAGQEPEVLRWILDLAKSDESEIDYDDVISVVKRIRDQLVTDLKGY